MEKGWVGAETSVADREGGVELERSPDWADLQLPDRECERLHAIARSVRQRAKSHRDGESVAGVIALFVGERGTGKTMAARILGAELGRPVLEVDVHGVRLRDEAEIDAVFAAADREDAILIIEMNRPPANAREGSSDDAGPAVDICLELVQRATRHPGLVIFTWIPGDAHVAMSVRASAVLNAATDATVRFPIPSAGIRERIWRAQLPPGAALSEADLQHLANSFRLPGGAIKWCCAVAREFSNEGGVPVTPVLLQRVIEQEYPEAAIDDELSDALEMQDATAELAAERATSASARSARKLVIGAALAAAVLGFLLARGTSGRPTGSAPAKPAANVLLRVSIPGGWHQRNAPTGVTPSLSDALAVAPAGQNRGLLVLGRSQTANPSVLRRPFAGLATVSAPQLLSLGGTRFYRYANLVPPGAHSSESVYALPTTVGTVLGVCEPQSAGDTFAAQCERVLASLKLRSGSPLAPGPSASLGAALDRVITGLSLARGPAEKRFDAAGTPAAQASAAAALAAAYGHAASALGSLDAGTARPAAAALATALAATANAYSGLVGAAHRADVKAYRLASAELSAARNAVNSALSQLNALGYRVS